MLLVGVALVLFSMVDTAATAWGPVYLSSGKVFDHPPTSTATFALATLPYLAATLLARSVGDQLTARVGGAVMVRVGAAVACLGVSVIAPLSFSAAARLAGHEGDSAARQRRVDAVIARFNQFNYVGALFGAVLTGAIGHDNLRIGYAVPMVLILAIIPLARHFGTAGART